MALTTPSTINPIVEKDRKTKIVQIQNIRYEEDIA
mgnify:CR=1 FL=1